MNRIGKALFVLLILATAMVASAQISVRRAPEWFPVDYGYDSQVSSERRFVIQNQTEYEDYLQTAFGRRRSHLRFDIPWDRVMLVAFHVGPTLNTGYEVYVESIQVAIPNGVTINYAHKNPYFGEPTQMVRTSPYMIVMLERPSGQVGFIKKLTTVPMDTYYGRNPIRGFGCTYPAYNSWGCPHSCACCNNEPRLLYTEVYYPNLSNYFSGATAMPAIQWRTYKDGGFSKHNELHTRIINNEAEWQSYWSKAFGESPSQAPRDIQWGKEMAVAIHVGEMRAGGTKVYVESISRPRPHDVVVSYVVSSPAPGTPVAQVISQPWVIIRMDRSAGNISFARRNVSQRVIPGGGNCNCGGKCGCKCCGRGQ
ncbi:MAG: protease complex subunit PrcB family protein [Fimbriimonadaceae bacterium]|nr:protease complex subunit PrcB family protein [Fimbriimonadaceae bacterium]